MMKKKGLYLLIIPGALYLLLTVTELLLFRQNDNNYIIYNNFLPIVIFFLSTHAILKDDYKRAFFGMIVVFILNIYLGLPERFMDHSIILNWVGVHYCFLYLFSAVITVGICVTYSQLCKNKNDTRIRATASAFCSASFIVLLTLMNDITDISRDRDNYILPVSGELLVYEIISFTGMCIMIAAIFGKVNKFLSVVYKAISVICLPLGITMYYLTHLYLPFEYLNNLRFVNINIIITSPLLLIGLFLGVTTCIRSEIIRNL